MNYCTCIGYCTFWGLYEFNRSAQHSCLHMTVVTDIATDCTFYGLSYLPRASGKTLPAAHAQWRLSNNFPISIYCRALSVYWPTCQIMELNRLEIWKIRRSHWTKYSFEHWCKFRTVNPNLLITTIVPYAIRFDLDDTPSNSASPASHPDLSYLTLGLH